MIGFPLRAAARFTAAFSLVFFSATAAATFLLDVDFAILVAPTFAVGSLDFIGFAAPNLTGPVFTNPVFTGATTAAGFAGAVATLTLLAPIALLAGLAAGDLAAGDLETAIFAAPFLAASFFATPAFVVPAFTVAGSTVADLGFAAEGLLAGVAIAGVGSDLETLPFAGFVAGPADMAWFVFLPMVRS